MTSCPCNTSAAHWLGPFALWSAFPTADYYGPSVPSWPTQQTTRRPACTTTPCKGGRGQGGSHVHQQPFRRRGAQLCPSGIATSTPQSFLVASAPTTSTATESLASRACTATQPLSARFELVVLHLRSFSTGFSRTPSCIACRAPGCLAVPTGLGVVGAAYHPAKPSRLAELPPASRGCCDSRAAESFHLRTVDGASWRSISHDQIWSGPVARSSGLTVAGCVACRRRSRTSPSARSRRYMVGTEHR